MRNHLEINPASTLRKVRGAGYEYVELAGTVGLEPPLFKKLLSDAGLKPISAHLPYANVVGDPASAADYARLFEVDYLVVPIIDRDLTPDQAGWTNCGKALGRAGAALRTAGITLCYHNHGHDFERVEDVYPIDLLADAAAPENLVLELDTYWIKYAGLDPAATLEKYAGRCPLLHIKDMAGKARAFAEIGRGVIHWPDIFEKGAAAGVRWYIVEQDTCSGDSIESARISAIYLKEH
ncbi:MAG: sugar phosphate isomerase/epimerase [Candidatus Hydrogenedentes bacterium]|nr:sugar phosphate isomerase/epimerase [Candidatus Hydrogenedentota bacterium]